MVDRADRDAPARVHAAHLEPGPHTCTIGGDWHGVRHGRQRAERRRSRRRAPHRRPRRTSRPAPAVRRCSTASTSSAAIRSSRSTCTTRSATSTPTLDVLTLTDKVLHTLQPRPPAQPSTASRWCASPAASTTRRSSASRRSSPSSTPTHRCGSTSPMSQGIIEFARTTSRSCVTPFTLAGAMAPITLAGALAQQNAEALAGIAFTQIVQPRRAGRSTAASPRTSTCSRARRRSARPSTCARRWSAASWPGATACPTASSNVCAANARRRPGRVRERVLAVGRGHGRRQLPDARRRLDGGRPARQLREDDPRRRPAADGRRDARPGRRRRRHARASTRSPRSAPAATSSAPRTPRTASATRSTRR